MKKSHINMPVDEAIRQLTISLVNKGFEIFADIDHAANAKAVNMELADSRVLIFGNPQAGTKLMQQDIFISLELPL